MAMAMLIDTSKCTACRGCQVACKQWNDLPGEKTHNWGSYQNPEHLSATTWKLVTFNEVGEGDDFRWNFVPTQCFHCAEASCVSVCPTGAAYHHGDVVLIDQSQCIGCGYCVEACPFGVPHSMPGPDHRHKSTARKCTFCIDRISSGLTPACAKTCPAGAYKVGERSDLVAAGRARVDRLKAKGDKNATLYGENELGGLQVMLVLRDTPDNYGLPVNPRVATKNVIGQWLSGFVAAGIVAALPFWMLTKRKNELAVKEGGE
jgi:formate dehydrogenase iron-sulfur subunit